MTKFYGILMVIAFAAVIAVGMVLGNNLGHSAGTVLQNWSDQQETTATKTPPPLTTVISIGKEGK